MTTISSTPFIDTHLLEDIYTKITDDRLWKLDEVILTLPELKVKKYDTAEMIINSETIQLQGQYQLTVSE